jgi:hypothetical protein
MEKYCMSEELIKVSNVKSYLLLVVISSSFIISVVLFFILFGTDLLVMNLIVLCGSILILLIPPFFMPKTINITSKTITLFFIFYGKIIRSHNIKELTINKVIINNRVMLQVETKNILMPYMQRIILSKKNTGKRINELEMLLESMRKN